MGVARRRHVLDLMCARTCTCLCRGVDTHLTINGHTLHMCSSSMTIRPCLLLLPGCADATQPESFCGLILLAPMISLDKVKQRGLNPILM